MGTAARERHRGQRAGWLRAVVLGADDGIVSVASLMIGVIAAGASRGTILTAAAAALVAGAMSMAAGEYVSVSSQRDTERADLGQERRELASDPAGERRELAAIYRSRGAEVPCGRRLGACRENPTDRVASGDRQRENYTVVSLPFDLTYGLAVGVQLRT
jgi:vacuolar iron transporter family protein